MSYDVDFLIDAGGTELVQLGNGHNYTYNCSAMFALALGGNGINDLNGKIAGDLCDPLFNAIRHMQDPANRATYKAMNPPNGWGNHQGALKFLRDIFEDCGRFSRATVRVS